MGLGSQFACGPIDARLLGVDDSPVSEIWPNDAPRRSLTMVPAVPAQTTRKAARLAQEVPPAQLRDWFAPWLALLLGATLLLVSATIGDGLRKQGKLAVESVLPLQAERAGASHALPPARPQARVVVRIPDSAVALAGYFHKLGYQLSEVRSGGDVPRVYVSALPSDLDELQPIERRKALFLRSVLPLVLKENERLRQERERLLRLSERLRAGLPASGEDDAWLARLYESYQVRPGDLATLLRRVDAVPPSLALAQAATESGWGTSRFAREGNALFGMWTWSDAVPGIVPLERDEDSRHRVRAFATLEASVRTYIRTLNTHRAYREFRDHREALRRAGKPLNGLALSRGMSRYSEERESYTGRLRAVIRINELNRLDRTTLGEGWDETTAAAARPLGSPALIAQEPGR